jgi:replicative DNA helicase
MLFIKPSLFTEISVTKEMFSRAKNADMFETMQALYWKGTSIDEKIITEEKPELDRSYVFDVANTVASAANWKWYEDAMKDEWTRERLERLGKVLATGAMPNNPPTTEELIDNIYTELELISGSSGRRSIVKIGESLLQYIEHLEQAYNNRGKLPGISTGIEGFDRHTQGLQKGLLYVIGARPSQGKSALALNMARHISVTEHIPCGMILAESSVRSAINRLVADLGNVNGVKVNSGFMAHKDFASIIEASGKLYEAPMYIWDQANPKLIDCKSVARLLVRKNKIQVLFVDYAQIIRVPGAIDRRSSAEEVSMSMKELARDLDIPVVLLAQLGRDADERRPGMGDFQWSSQFEQDADVAALLWHVYDKNTPKLINESYLLMEKVKDGPTGSVRLTFEKDYVRFTDYAEKEKASEKEESASLPYSD